MLGRVMSLQIAPASRASFLSVSTYGFMNWGAISLTACAYTLSVFAQ
jgi:hypothetical protein